MERYKLAVEAKRRNCLLKRSATMAPLGHKNSVRLGLIQCGCFGGWKRKSRRNHGTALWIVG